MGGYSLIENAPLGQRNTLRVNARARLLAEIRESAKLPEILDFPAVRQGKLLVLGEGSNMLFTGDFDGTVLAMATRGVHVEEDGDIARIAVAAGERWDDFVRWTLGQGFAGLENLILIPGTVGAAPIQNIGAYGTEVAEFIESVEAWDTKERRVAVLDRQACAFAYRDSVFKHEPGRYIVTAVKFALPRSRELRLDYAGIREELARMGIERPAPFHVAEAVVHLRTRKLPDPAVIGNAGSFFKNPIVDASVGEALKAAHPELVSWVGSDGRWKLSAAWLIEQAGFKGDRDGDAGISNRHALVLVNHGQATGPQLWGFAQRVIEGVRGKFGVTLEPEPVVV
ncbi:UDP-N-acetylmuramate dehydrogenase [Dyella terrae]|uniref:UDP-N-acetylenolpyruvoylglucosamine reductase n=3 Tax=Dyella TaxID=231454 RepID=A0A4R0Z3I4_9GAMM|nr:MULTISPECIES: UDP-N-acetylmuramate dehydrogenase [Dyella]TBR40710.1 UDP-N-acetylmuramate dehydrogenase [Dyella terrae]TCI13816.1 UDP-N-acetylmuramate dehydrogenase [Dyella soli]